jgi:transcriptional regulator with XRE-family HTH domain
MIMKLKEYRKLQGKTQLEMSRVFDLTPNRYSDLERGFDTPNWTTMKRVYKATGGLVTPNDFMPDDLIQDPKNKLSAPCFESEDPFNALQDLCF